jgi:serine/threonine-protein kinase RsbW
MRLVVDLTLPNDARLIARTRRVVSGYLEALGADRDAVADVVLALDEACTNVVLHALPEPGDSFHLRAEVSEDDVLVVVEDEGVGLPAGFEPAAGPTSATTGRGLHIIRQLMTDVSVQTAPERAGTRVEMRRELRPGSR